MKEQIFALTSFLFVLFSVGIVSAHETGQPHQEINFTKISNYQIPDVIGKLIGDAHVNIYDYDYVELGSIILFNGTVNETSNEFLENPTHFIYVKDAETLQNIFDADSFVKEFNRQRSLHNIRLEAVNFFDQIKLIVGTWITSIISLFISPE